MKKFRKNEEIGALNVRLINKDGEQLGVVPLLQAQKEADSHQLDLVEISPQSDPPVCKILDFGTFLYEKKKQEKQQKKLGKSQSTKEIKFGIRISDHDFDVRLARTRTFLEKGHIVRVILQFRGREQAHADIGIKRIEQMTVDLEDIAKQEFAPKPQGRSVFTEFRPLSKKKR